MISVHTQWFHCFRPRPKARLRLLCFPHAGGGATFFHSWSEKVPIEVELYALQLPGRERRVKEPVQTNPERLFEELFPAVRKLADRPIALFGFSLGALLAFETARYLNEMDQRLLLQLLVAAKQAPQLVRPTTIHRLKEREFVKQLEKNYGGLPEVVRDEPDLLEFFLPIIRADIMLSETYQFQESVPLHCPITAYGGLADSSTTQEQLSAWESQTAGPFELRMFRGNHFFVKSAEDEILKDLSVRFGSSEC